MKEGQPHDFSIDVWQLGQLAYQLCCKPHLGGLPYRILKEHDDDDKAKWMEWVPVKVKQLILSMVRKKPSARPKIKDILAHSWFEDDFG